MAYFNVTIPANSICDVEWAFGDDLAFSAETEVCNILSDELTFSTDPGQPPSVDSSFFDVCEFGAAARALTAWFTQASHFALVCARRATLSPAQVLHALFLLTPFPLGAALRPRRAARLCAVDAESLWRAIEDMPIDVAEFEKVLCADCRLTNRYALPVGAGARPSECVMVDDRGIRFLKEPETVTGRGVLLLLSAVQGSVIERLVSVRCFFVLCLQRGEKPSNRLRNFLRDLPHGRSAFEMCQQLFPDDADARFPADFPFDLAFGMKEWRFDHSATIALCDHFDLDVFKKLPLSSRFKFETVAFVETHIQPLREGDTLEGFALGLGFAEEDRVREFITEFFSAAAWLSDVHCDPASAFEMHRCARGSAAAEMLFSLVRELPTVSLFLFAKWLHGGCRVRTKRFIVVSVGEENLIAVSPLERALLIGAFADESAFAAALLAEIENAAETYFVYH
jgi:hypothetical protein